MLEVKDTNYGYVTNMSTADLLTQMQSNWCDAKLRSVSDLCVIKLIDPTSGSCKSVDEDLCAECIRSWLQRKSIVGRR